MERMEMVEKLRLKAQVSYEEAKLALENSDWDLLDALVYLEKEGKVDKAQPDGYTEHREQPVPQGKGFWENLGEGINRVYRRLTALSLRVRLDSKTVFELPLLVFILLFFIFRRSLLMVMLFSLLFGISYRFIGQSKQQPEAERAQNRDGGAA